MEQVEVTKGTSNKPSASIRTSIDQQHTGGLAMEQHKHLEKYGEGWSKEGKSPTQNKNAIFGHIQLLPNRPFNSAVFWNVCDFQLRETKRHRKAMHAQTSTNILDRIYIAYIF